MILLGHGIDIVEIARVDRLLKKNREDFLYGWFSELEIQISKGEARILEFLAGRVAAKEAFAKSVGDYETDELIWPDVIIDKSANGRPTVRLAPGSKIESDMRHVSDWMVSISHSEAFAIASVIAVAAD